MNKKIKIISLIVAALFLLTIIGGIIAICLSRDNNSFASADEYDYDFGYGWNVDDSDPIRVEGVFEFVEEFPVGTCEQWSTNGDYYVFDINFVVGYRDYNYLCDYIYVYIDPSDSIILGYHMYNPFYREFDEGDVYYGFASWTHDEYRTITISSMVDRSFYNFLITFAINKNDEKVLEYYNIGYNEGNQIGYNSGYDEGVSSGYSDGYSSGYIYGQSQGYNVGYDDGFYDGGLEGYNEGYAHGKYDGLTDNSAYDVGYDKGYREAAEEYYYLGLDDGKTEGYTNGYTNGYTDGENKSLSIQLTDPISSFIQPVHVFMNTKFFGDLTYATLFNIVLFVAVALIFIKMFSGG